jgi:hypothetical protein
MGFSNGMQAKAPDAPAAEAAAAEEAEEDAEVQAAEAAHAAKVTVLKDMKVATPEQWAAAKKSGETLKVRALVHSRAATPHEASGPCGRQRLRLPGWSLARGSLALLVAAAAF